MTKIDDQYIEEHYIGNPLHNNTIYLEEYNEEWETLFNKEQERIKDILKEKGIDD